MNLEQIIERYQQIRQKIKAYHYAMGIISWDSATEAPAGCFEKRAEYSGVLSEMLYTLETSDEYKQLIAQLYEHKDELDPVLRHEIIEIKRSNDKQNRIPMEEYVSYATLMANAEQVWAKAKKENDYSQFAPLFQKVVDYQKKYVKWQESDALKGYDILLDEYEHDFTTKEYDKFFDCLKRELVPFVKKVIEKGYPGKEDLTKLVIPADKQRKVAQEIEKILCYDLNRGLSKESEHPFTTGSGTYDVRYTNHFHEDKFESSIFSAVHELGHSLYEQQIDPQLDDTFVGGGASSAMHESQSRFYENMIGRSKAFVKVLLPKFNKICGVDLDEEEFYYHINKVENSLIRIEADELTYPLHIMLRYDLERALMNDEITVDELPQEWNKRFKEYFGIEVPNDAVGVLQDIHWGTGLFGYFPTYALGSAYAAQFYHAMSKDLDIEASLGEGTTKKINDWLKEKIHWCGSSRYPKEIMVQATGEEFDPMYYVEYLKNKYSDMYKI
ncbi:MAG: carboxypeptidase M32 [Erysipelotrichaceae bacterium]|nr:carboxypeptidase M32 [Erysipelotrichaceae bacterium]